jgi:LPXTG-motif cell wall-anchored protein
MSGKRNVVVLTIGIVILGAVVAAAQTVNYEIKRGTVVTTYGNHLVVKMDNGETKDVEIPDGFTFDVDGRQLSVNQLTPGTELTAAKVTTTTPVTVEVTEVRNVTVVRRSGQTIVVRNQEGKLKKFSQVPENIRLETTDGQAMNYTDLQPGMVLTAYIVHQGVTDVTEEDIAVAGTAPPRPAPAAAPAARPAPKAAPAPAVLPKTGSSLPLAGLGGIALLIIAIGIAVYRRF